MTEYCVCGGKIIEENYHKFCDKCKWSGQR